MTDGFWMPVRLVPLWFITMVCILLSTVSVASEKRGFLGMQVQGISARIGNALRLDRSAGVLVRDISVDGPASNAGIRRGDLIITMQGQDIDTFERMLQIASKWQIGDKVTVELLRGGKKVSTELTLTGWPDGWRVQESSFAAQPDLGLTFAALTPKIRKQLGIRWGSTGIVVTVSNDQFAGITPLRRGDLVVQINQQRVWNPKQFLEIYSAAKDAGDPYLLILVERTSGFKYVLQPVETTVSAPVPSFKLPGQGG